ncbi:rod-binding protein [Pseudodesulfovibrio sediminis]|uniref:Flagellar protein FlgJ N-terminal domain-containing protein n=1 Tax=Pseudodesulfovibrio sediminis TaxID=2810563 RepID=A0ABM7P1Z3_9BACT|nr:rod-binding protein [Pseudodesulfovibrio sediminis]BCS86812.1 hypothetical protein PSDVSF_00540 [Pseudodesulfovibrio sediminis]
MISSTVDPRLAAKQADTKDLIRFKQEMDGLKERLTDKGANGQLKKACQNFEAVFIGKLWQQMRQSVQKEGYLHSKQEDSYISMFDRDFSEKMAQAGGIGLADMIYAQLSEKLKETSKTTLAGGVAIKPLKEEKPISVNQPGAGIQINTGKGITLEEWGGSVSSEASGGNAVVPAPAAQVSTQEVGSTPKLLTDVEVQAKLDTLVRRLESEHLRDSLTQGRAQGEEYTDKAVEALGRKIAQRG